MKIYDSLTQTNKILGSDDQVLNIYSCGPTVYNYIHLGNARPNMLLDILVRFLRFENKKVNYFQNITDVDDKIIFKALSEQVLEQVIATKFYDQYKLDLTALNIIHPDKFFPISLEISPMIEFIESLIKSNDAYVVDGDVYFNLEKYKGQYGHLAQRKIGDLIAGERVEIDQKKRNPLDFSLWKKTEVGIKWPASFGQGRPGWHTECVYLIDKHFNSQTIDLHAGGVDLKFPHHENERIQFIAKNHQELAKIWMHNGHLTIDNLKMSKSLGNVILVKDFVQENNPNVLRWIFLTTKYTQPLNINQDLIDQGNKFLDKIFNLEKKIKQVIMINNLSISSNTYVEENVINKFKNYMNDDLSTPMVLTLIDEIMKKINISMIENNCLDNCLSLIRSLKLIFDVLGFKDIFDFSFDQETQKKFLLWKKLIEQKDFLKADVLRNELVKKGIL